MKLAGVAVMAAIASSSSNAFNLLSTHHASPSSSSIFFRSVDACARNHPRRRVASILSSAIISADYAGSNDNNDGNDNASSMSSSSHAVADGTTMTKQQRRIQQIRKEGGMFAFNTKYGALNPFSIYYGITSIVLGFVWVAAITACDILYKLTGNKIDSRRRAPVFLSHIWGRLLMLFTGCTPTIVNGNIVKDFHKR